MDKFSDAMTSVLSSAEHQLGGEQAKLRSVNAL